MLADFVTSLGKVHHPSLASRASTLQMDKTLDSCANSTSGLTPDWPYNPVARPNVITTA